MFWEYGVGISNVDQLLEKEEPPSLEELLDENDLLQELKSHNEKLVNFLSEEENISKLVKHVTSEPPLDLDEKIRFRYPTIACEIFISNISSIDNVFFDDNKYIKCFWNVIKEPTSSNNLIFCYVVKVISHYFSFRQQDLCTFLKDEEPLFLSHLLQHVDVPYICDLVSRLITITVDESKLFFYNEFRNNNFALELIKYISIDQPSEKILGAANVITEIVHNVRSPADKDEIERIDTMLLMELQRDDHLTLLVQNMMNGKSFSTVLFAGATVLSALFNYQRIGHATGEEFCNPTSLYSHLMKYPKTDFTNFLPHISQLLHLITKEIKNDTLLSPDNNTIVICTRARALIVECLVSLMLHNDDAIAKEFDSLNIFSILLNYFEDYPSNNFIHSQIELIVTSVLQGHRWKVIDTAYTTHVTNTLITSLLEKAHFISKLIHLWPIKSEYTGHIKEIARVLRSCMREGYHSDYINSYIKNLPENILSSFKYCEDQLTKFDEVEFVDRKFMMSMSMELEDTNYDIPTMSSGPHQFYISLEKGLSMLKQSKQVLTFNDVPDKIEGDMEADLDTSFKDDHLSDFDLRLPPLSVSSEIFDNVAFMVNEEIRPYASVDNSSSSFDADEDFMLPHRRASSSSVSIESPIAPNINFEPMTTSPLSDSDVIDSIVSSRGEGRRFSLPGFADESFLTAGNSNFIRGGTSSPLPLDFSASEENDAFESDESLGQTSEPLSNT